MHGRRRDAERSSCLLYRQKFAIGRFRFSLITRYFPSLAQIGHVMGLETMTVGGLTTLAIEDAGDHSILIMRSQAAHERKRILIGANDLRLGVRQIKVEFGERTALPAHREMCCKRFALHFDDDFFEQRSEQLLAVTRRSRRRIPHSVDICSDREQACAFCLRKHTGAFRFAAGELSLCRLERAQALLPLALKATGNQAIVWIDGAITPFGTARLITRPLDAETPLPEGCLAIGLEALSSGDGGSKPCWF